MSQRPKEAAGPGPASAPDAIKAHGVRVHTPKDIDITVPLSKLVAIAGVRGSGKSSLALGVLYAQGRRRCAEGLSAYTRRRLTRPRSRPSTASSMCPARYLREVLAPLRPAVTALGGPRSVGRRRAGVCRASLTCRCWLRGPRRRPG
ncbi:hypothetical protein [Streptomyces sp. NBC_00140]|uniref:hypothetical protein n=1 Tax=Streptomyces sp. NBC_00140 TaxID=2975664 RepID=UPI00224D2F7D|nr:hypothetical protein [Streptomyces sp. NBC_00140]MCX5328751.1 hypothetical protein [Streptomyces sp. NBC_00140]